MDNILQELTDIGPGLWLWQVQYLDWPRGDGWDGKVVSTCVESGGKIVLLDPVAPTQEGSKLWTRLDARPPTLIVILKPDHVRDVDFFVRRYGVRAFGPDVFNRDDVPETELEFALPGSTLLGGLVALYDGRGRNETPIWLPEHRTIVLRMHSLPRKESFWYGPALGLLLNLAAFASILFILSMTLIPILERLFIRDLIGRGEREGRKIEAVREKVQFKAAKKNHAR
jgi:hypothetical protein